MDEVVLENESGRVVVSPRAGASLRSLRVTPAARPYLELRVGMSVESAEIRPRNAEWVELLTGGDDPHDPTTLPQGTGSFIMAPWPNRLRYGILRAGGAEYQMPINRPPHAIHGFVRDREWEVVKATGSAARLSVALDDPWPFAGTVKYNISLDGPSLVQSLTIEAPEGGQPFPAGFGWHPWFRRDLGTGSPRVQVAGQRTVWEVDEEFSATGRQLDVEQVPDLRKGLVPELGQVDQCMRIEPGSPTVVQWPNAITLEINSSTEMGQLQVYAPEESVCVEPESCTVNAFRLAQEDIADTGTVEVAPGHPLSGWTRWSWA